MDLEAPLGYLPVTELTLFQVPGVLRLMTFQGVQVGE